MKKLCLSVLAATSLVSAVAFAAPATGLASKTAAFSYPAEVGVINRSKIDVIVTLNSYPQNNEIVRAAVSAHSSRSLWTNANIAMYAHILDGMGNPIINYRGQPIVMYACPHANIELDNVNGSFTGHISDALNADNTKIDPNCTSRSF